MQKLNFSNYSFRFKNSENKTYIFDIIRKKFLLLTPEEWVRQHVLNYLIEDLKYPKSLINVEKLVNVNGLKRRYDIVVFHTDGSFFLLVECKAPEVQITQGTFDQIAQYNFVLKAENLMITNGLNHYFCQMDFENEQYVFLKELPEFSK
ncbi:MAG: type I restriction enzyme HsdR N-terminal domain-containing protein [Flavobacterium sp.]|nr:type I restriction enzyme HsdR N-terminal domain-containing protein [Flavobacterium sp.]